MYHPEQKVHRGRSDPANIRNTQVSSIFPEDSAVGIMVYITYMYRTVMTNE